MADRAKEKASTPKQGAAADGTTRMTSLLRNLQNCQIAIRKEPSCEEDGASGLTVLEESVAELCLGSKEGREVLHCSDRMR